MITQSQSLQPAWWLVRIPDVFSDLAGQIAPGSEVKVGEGDYHRLAAGGVDFPLAEEARIFPRWQLPVHHAWPCNPQKIDRFVEKAAKAIAGKFSSHAPRALQVGAFEPMAANGYFRKLASNVRGRVLQLMPAADADCDSLGPDDAVVFVLVGRTGLFCGLQTPRQANGFHAGGTRFIRQADCDVPSRAGAKIAEALHHMRLLGGPPQAGAHWIELGASPGGMTAELVRHGYGVAAIDRAPLHPSLNGVKGVEFFRADVAQWKPRAGQRCDALLCDMNGSADFSFGEVVRLSSALRAGAPLVFTLKTAGAEGFREILDSHERVLAIGKKAGLAHLQTTHLTYNRREFTMFFRKG